MNRFWKVQVCFAFIQALVLGRGVSLDSAGRGLTPQTRKIARASRHTLSEFLLLIQKPNLFFACAKAEWRCSRKFQTQCMTTITSGERIFKYWQRYFVSRVFNELEDMWFQSDLNSVGGSNSSHRFVIQLPVLYNARITTRSLVHHTRRWAWKAFLCPATLQSRAQNASQDAIQ